MVCHKRFLMFLVVLVGLVMGLAACAAPEVTPVYTPPRGEITAEAAEEAFRQFAQSLPDPQFLLGEPLGAVVKSGEGWKKYYTHMVLRMDSGGRIRPEALGYYFRMRGKPYLEQAQTWECKQVGEHLVCYAFLDVFEKFGGVQIFGNPLGPIETDGLRVYQDFENARMLFDYQARYRIILDDWGRTAWAQVQKNAPQAGPDTEFANQVPLRLKVVVEKPVLTARDTQHITILVTDTQYKPLANVPVQIVLSDESGEALDSLSRASNEMGLIRFPYRLPEGYTGKIFIEAVAEHEGQKIVARRSFRVVGP